MAWRVKGRPKLCARKRDFGTMELQQKRLMRVTDDPLDLALERKIISKNQYYSGMRLRYLHKQIFGHMDIRAYDWCHLRGKSSQDESDDAELGKNQRLYNNAMRKLSANNFYTIITAVCFYSEIPNFLRISLSSLSSTDLSTAQCLELEHFKDAMHALEKILT